MSNFLKKQQVFTLVRTYDETATAMFLILFAVLGINGSLLAFENGVKTGDTIEALQGIGVFAYGLCIYAITKENANMMIPALIWSSISSVLVTPFTNIISLVKYVALPNAPPDKSPETSVLMWLVKYLAFRNPPSDQLTTEEVIVGIFGCVAYVMVTALLVHFYLVLQALYKEFKNLSGIDSNKSIV